jgi:hypothetical protein
MRALLPLICLVAACGEDESHMIVTVERRPAVHDARTLRVTLENAGAMRTEQLRIDEGETFPLTFSISAPGREGDLEIRIDALDVMGLLRGRGIGSTSLDQAAASVVLDSADFVVNHEPAGDQFLSSDFEAVGFQLAATANNQWMAAYREQCTSCTILGRRFDATGLPVFSQLAAGDLGFPISTTPTTGGAMPAVAASGQTTLAFWDFTATSGGARGVACRAINDMGAASFVQREISSDPADVVSAAALPNGNFAAVWQIYRGTAPAGYVIRSAVVRPDCTVLGNVVDVSTDLGMGIGAQRPHVAANANNLLYAWVVDGGLRVRSATLAGVFAGPEVTLLPQVGGQRVEFARLTPWQSGFAIAVRWASMASDGPGRIEVHRTNAVGQLMGAPILITDKSRSDFASRKGFGIAQRSDGALLVVWHVCEAGPGLCDVLGRVLRPTGAPVGEPFMVPTSTASEQINPSVVALQDAFVAAWTDSSGEAPDRDGTSVRARILYPVYDDARGVHGATCGTSATGTASCNDGLTCATGSDAVQRCYATCSPSSCPAGGTCTLVDGTSSHACVY